MEEDTLEVVSDADTVICGEIVGAHVHLECRHGIEQQADADFGVDDVVAICMNDVGVAFLELVDFARSRVNFLTAGFKVVVDGDANGILDMLALLLIQEGRIRRCADGCGCKILHCLHSFISLRKGAKFERLENNRQFRDGYYTTYGGYCQYKLMF